MKATDNEIIRNALLHWRNHIQTGNIILSSQDLLNQGLSKKCRMLNSDQQELVIVLEDLAEGFNHE